MYLFLKAHHLFYKENYSAWVWYYILLVPALRKPRQEDHLSSRLTGLHSEILFPKKQTNKQQKQNKEIV